MSKFLKGIAGAAALGLVARRFKARAGEPPPPTQTHPSRARPVEHTQPPDRPAAGGPEPESPLDLEPQDWKATLKRTLKEIKGDRVTLTAAGMAYYFFLAIFPALIAFVGILDLVDVDADALIESIRSALPGGAGTALTAALENDQAETASLIAAVTGVLAALFSASSGMVALQKGLDVAYDIDEDRKFAGARGVALLLLLATVVLGGVPSPIFTFGESSVYTVLGWVLTVVAIVVLFSIYYYLSPKRDQPTWRWISVGGVVGAALWIVGSLAFGFYVTNFNNYGKTYGPLAGVVVLILWLYLSSLAVLIGGELNAELERQVRAKS
ncbi:MAG TPA: YihY/virulence factor BrkB family protein [Actinomycetota bacterium]|jgi:membrane protein